jgi:hypothetical protein
VYDWPQDEEASLKAAGWEPGLGYCVWLEPAVDWMGLPTPEMLEKAREQVLSYEVMLKHFKSDPLRREDLQTGLTKAKTKLELYESGKPVPLHNREQYPQQVAVARELTRHRPFKPKPRVTEVPTYTEQQVDLIEKQTRERRNGTLLKEDVAALRERRNMKSKLHTNMCAECRQW